MTLWRVVLLLCFVGVAYPRTQEQIVKSFVKVALRCTKTIKVSDSDIAMLKNLTVPDDKNGTCVIQCMFQNKGMVDAVGMFDENGAINMSKTEFGNDQSKINNSIQLYEKCKYVNNLTVSDSCQRSAALAHCLLDNARNWGFQITYNENSLYDDYYDNNEEESEDIDE